MRERSAAAMCAIARRYFDCLDSEDWDSMAELWTPDAQLRAVGARPRMDREAVLEYFRKLFDPWPAHRDHPDRLIASEADQVVVAEVTFTGTTPDGRAVRFEAIDVFDFEDGRIRKLTNWYDIDYARRALTPADATPGSA
jgi:ketosteroid isomerase-like protein